MHSHSVMDKGETSVCTEFKAERRVDAVLVDLANKIEKMCAQGNIIMMHSHSVMDKEETSVCTNSKQRRDGAVSVTCK